MHTHAPHALRTLPPVRWLRQSIVFPARARRLGLRIPPGDLRPADERAREDRSFFLDRAREHGPVFKANLNGTYTTCIVGHGLGLKLVSAHDDRLPGFTIDLTRLFPIGALRGMSGDTHRKYRRIVLRALMATPLTAHAEAIEQAVHDTLRTLADSAPPLSGGAIRDPLRRLTTAIMLRILFGVTPESAAFKELGNAYRAFGPDAPAKRIDGARAEAFARISARLEILVPAATRAGAAPSLLGHMVRAGDLDATALGNLAYLFEPSHFDLYSLWHWIVVLLAGHEEVQSCYHGSAGEERHRYAGAIVLESLRMEQSEQLYRRVTDDITFEGFLIPRETSVRICLWEGHKNGETFPEPFAFRPERFLEPKPGHEAYAPFGLGPRHCLGSSLVLGLSTMFVQALLDRYRIERVSDAPPVLGAYHWQPGPGTAIRLVAPPA